MHPKGAPRESLWAKKQINRRCIHAIRIIASICPIQPGSLLFYSVIFVSFVVYFSIFNSAPSVYPVKFGFANPFKRRITNQNHFPFDQIRGGFPFRILSKLPKAFAKPCKCSNIDSNAFFESPANTAFTISSCFP